MSLIPDHVRVLPPFDPATGDIFLLRRIVWTEADAHVGRPVVCCSIPQSLWLWDDVYFGWGPQRRESATLALNILDALIPYAPGAVCNDWHRPLDCSEECVRLAGQFADDFLAELPYWGGRLPGHVSRSWIKTQRYRWDLDGLDLSLTTLTDRWPKWPMGE